jgi:hypothetical protein
MVTRVSDLISGNYILRFYGIAQQYSAGLRAGYQQGFLFATASRPAIGPTQFPIQWVTGYPSLGVKRPGREATYLHLVTRSKNAWSYTSTSPIGLNGVVPTLSTGTTLPLPHKIAVKN